MSLNLATNPLRAGLPRERVVDPCAVVIFGGTGDLAHRKLLPALYHLHAAALLPMSFAIVGYASSEFTDSQYRDWVREAIAKSSPDLPTEGRMWEEFSGCLRYVRRVADTETSFKNLKSRLAEVDETIDTEGNYLFFLAVPPSAFEESARGLKRVGLAHDERGRSWRRIVIEKPFGEDLASARKLNHALLEIFDEDQIYRIDHYLGKETVQNIMAFRFANQFVEPILNSRYVDHIQITVAESIGVEKRGAFYDKVGALRDIIQNHALQLMSFVCMEPPSSLDPESVRDEKLKVFRSIRRIKMSEVDDLVVRGQYQRGKLMGMEVPGYLEEPDVAPDSQTETFVALKLYVDNWRWRGLPVYIRTGKRLAKRVTDIAIQLKDIPPILFGETHREQIEPNVIAFSIQPDEGISIKFEAKVPGLGYRIQPVRMDFKYGSAFGESVPEAYERLLLDALLGDQSLFARGDGVEATWEVVDPILQWWRSSAARRVYQYAPGGWGPREAAELIERDGRRWRRL